MLLKLYDTWQEKAITKAYFRKKGINHFLPLLNKQQIKSINSLISKGIVKEHGEDFTVYEVK